MTELSGEQTLVRARQQVEVRVPSVLGANRRAMRGVGKDNIAPEHLSVAKQVFEHMLQLGIIRPSSSALSSQLHIE